MPFEPARSWQLLLFYGEYTVSSILTDSIGLLEPFLLKAPRRGLKILSRCLVSKLESTFSSGHLRLLGRNLTLLRYPCHILARPILDITLLTPHSQFPEHRVLGFCDETAG